MTLIEGSSSDIFQILADDVHLAGFALRGTGSTTLVRIDGTATGGIDRVSIQDCLLERGIGIRAQFASGRFEGNLVQNSQAIGVQINGGPAINPARIVFYRNRVILHSLNGVDIHGDAGYLTPPPTKIYVEVSENDFSQNGSAGQNVNGLPQFGSGLVFTIDDADDTNRQAEQIIDAEISANVHDNTFDGNSNYGLVVNGRIRAPASSARLSFFGSFTHNHYCGNGNNRALFGFTFYARSLKYGTPAYSQGNTRYFAASNYDLISVDDGLLQGFDFDNPVLDPDHLAIPLQNHLTFNGQPIAGTSIQSFGPPGSCP